MNRVYTSIAAAFLVTGIVGCGISMAQAPGPPDPSTVTQVESWTTQQ